MSGGLNSIKSQDFNVLGSFWSTGDSSGACLATLTANQTPPFLPFPESGDDVTSDHQEALLPTAPCMVLVLQLNTLNVFNFMKKVFDQFLIFSDI